LQSCLSFFFVQRYDYSFSPVFWTFLFSEYCVTEIMNHFHWCFVGCLNHLCCNAVNVWWFLLFHASYCRLYFICGSFQSTVRYPLDSGCSIDPQNVLSICSLLLFFFQYIVILVFHYSFGSTIFPVSLRLVTAMSIYGFAFSVWKRYSLPSSYSSYRTVAIFLLFHSLLRNRIVQVFPSMCHNLFQLLH